MQVLFGILAILAISVGINGAVINFEAVKESPSAIESPRELTAPAINGDVTEPVEESGAIESPKELIPLALSRGVYSGIINPGDRLLYR